MRYIDQKYVDLISAQLHGFKCVRNSVYNFACPFCGDSRTNKNKRRAYLYEKDEKLVFYCHNCSESMSFKQMLETLDTYLYKEYKKELLDEYLADKNVEREAKKREQESLFKQTAWTLPSMTLPTVAALGPDHPAYQYLINRNVPVSSFERVKWADDFQKFCDNQFGDKYANRCKGSGIVYELKNREGNIVGYQMRSIDANVSKAYRFITVHAGDERGFFGIARVDTSKPHFVVEGATDALFLNNSVAVISSSLFTAALPDAIYFQDQEPRNREVCKQLDKCISLGYKVVILPDEYIGMDINDIVNSGITYSDLPSFLMKNTYQGMMAKIKYAKWKK